MDSRDKQLAEIYQFIKNHNAPDDNLLNVKQVAQKLGVTLDTVWRHTRAGYIPRPVKLNGSTRWKRSEMNRYIASLKPDKKYDTQD